MIGELQKRPQSKHRKTFTKTFTEVSEANKRQSNECFQMGKDHMKNKQFQKALQHYFNAIMHNHNNYKAYCNMGTIFRTLSNFNEAKKAYIKAKKIKNDDSITLYNYGNVLRVTGDEEEAISQYEKVIEIKEVNKTDIGSLYEDTLINMGICYKNMGQYDKAIQVFDKAISGNLKDESGWFNKGMCYFKIIQKNSIKFQKLMQTMYHEANKSFQKVLEINPSNYMAKITLIEIRYIKEPFEATFEQSIQALKALQETCDENTKQYINIKIGYCLAALKKFEESSQYYNQGGIAKDTSSVVENVKRQTNYADFPQVNKNKNERPGSQSNNRKKSQNQRPKSSSNVGREKLKGMSPKQMFEHFLKEQNFDEAFLVVKEMPDEKQKFQLQIILNFTQGQVTGDEVFFPPAQAIYVEHFLKNNFDTPITKEFCSIECHQALATLLTYLQDHEQAIKHFEILAEYFRDEKMGNDPNKMKELEKLYGQMGNNYAERKLWDKAVEEYQKQFDLEPKNYFVMSNLAECLIENGKEDEALKLFEKYMQENKLQESEDKAKYIDCLLNMSICLKDTKKQFQALQRVQRQLEKYFPSYEQIIQNFQQTSIENLYLRLTQLYEEKYNSETETVQKRQSNQKLLDLYLSCLQFPSCPDREEICINCANLFYLNNNYANALNFYRKIQSKRDLVANNIGLTLANLEEHDLAFSCVQYASENSKQNSVYEMNFLIMKWMYGLREQGDSNQLINKYPCKCEAFSSERIRFGLTLIDKLTQTIKNQQNINAIKKDDKLNNLIKVSEDEAEIVFARKQLEKHLKEIDHSALPEKYIVNDLLSASLSLRINPEKYCEEVIFPKIEKLPKYLLNVSTTQVSLCTFFLANSQKQQEIREIVRKGSIQKGQIIELNTQIFKESGEGYFEKKVSIKYPNIDLTPKSLMKTIKEIQCIVESNSQLMLDYINKIYYEESQNLVSPLRVQRNYPHAQNVEANENSLIKFLNTLFEFTGIDFTFEYPFNQNINQYKSKFIKNCFEKFQKQIKKTHIYNQQKKQIVFTLNPDNLPITIKTHHQERNHILSFVRKIDTAFSEFNLPASSHAYGTEVIILNKSIRLELSWGEVSEVGKFLTNLERIRLNPEITCILLLGDDLGILSEISDEEEGFREKYQKILHLKW